MIMMIRRIAYSAFCVFLLFSGAVNLRGQDRDFQTWWELKLDKQISGNFGLEGELEQRFKNNSLQYSRTLLTLGASCDLLDFLKLGGGVRTVFVMNQEQELYARYRGHIDLTGSYEVSGLTLSLRTRLQYGFEEFPGPNTFSLNSLVNRNRLKAAYHIFGTKFDCQASVESWHSSDKESFWPYVAMRYSAGVRFSPNFRSRFSLRYILEDEFNTSDPGQLHIVVLGYAYNL
ncbi:MAG: DUF2490 domain-containing protein [Bacteroidales bacterium]|nr:DUF2490 domain-containing protein [Bacteroidales bacterium]